MRIMLAVAALFCPAMTVAQIASSGNWGCTVTGSGEKSGMGCDGLGVPPAKWDKDRPTLLVTDMRFEAGASWDFPVASSDYVVLGISGGDLLNEEAPFGHISLDKGSVTLMPRGKPFRLRNDGSKTVEFRLIEIHR